MYGMCHTTERSKVNVLMERWGVGMGDKVLQDKSFLHQMGSRTLESVRKVMHTFGSSHSILYVTGIS